MYNPFARTRSAAPQRESMREGLLLQQLPAGQDGVLVPPDCMGIAVAADGSTRRYAAGQILARQIPTAPWYKTFLVSTLPQRCQLCLHAACPEIALDLRYVLDSADPRTDRQRFDLFLASEVERDWSLADMAAQLQTLLQADIASGELECHPQMSLPEWMRFRAQLERWLYIRFGLTVEDCALVDVGASVDYAQILLSRLPQVVPDPVAGSVLPPVPAAVVPTSAPSPTPAPSPTSALSPTPAPPPAQAQPPAFPSLPAGRVTDDQQQLRRLFLEIPDFMMRWRALNPPSAMFALQQTILQKLAMLKVTVAAMPALTLAAPRENLAAWQIAVRTQAMQDAMQAWEQAWSLLARLQTGSDGTSGQVWAEAGTLDAISRIFANFEHALASRASVPQELP